MLCIFFYTLTFITSVPILPFRYGTYICNKNRQTSDPSDWWPFGPVTSNLFTQLPNSWFI